MFSEHLLLIRYSINAKPANIKTDHLYKVKHTQNAK